MLGKNGVGVIAVSELAKKYQATVPQVILAAQQQGYTVLGWDQYQHLLDEIGKLIGRHEDQGETAAPSKHIAHVAIGIPVTVADSTREVKIFPKSSPSFAL
jgi:hypothetical protein